MPRLIETFPGFGSWLKTKRIEGQKKLRDILPEVFLKQTSTEERQIMSDLFNLIEEKKLELGCDLHVFLVGSMAHHFFKPLSRGPHDIDIAIATSAEPGSKEQEKIVLALEELLKNHFKAQNISHTQEYGPYWVLIDVDSMDIRTGEKIKERLPFHTGEPQELRFVIHEGDNQRALDVLVNGINGRSIKQQLDWEQTRKDHSRRRRGQYLTLLSTSTGYNIFR